MKGYILAIACVALLAGCAEDGRYNREAGGYGASLNMNGGAGVRGVYPDAALYGNQFVGTNEYAANVFAPLTSGVGLGGTTVGTNQVVGGASSATVDVVNPFAPTIELIVPSGFATMSTEQSLMPTVELVVPSGFASGSITSSSQTASETIQSPAEPDSTAPAPAVPDASQVPQPPAPAPAQPQLEPQSAPAPAPYTKGPGKPL
jgi:hypothetical protein